MELKMADAKHVRFSVTVPVLSSICVPRSTAASDAQTGGVEEGVATRFTRLSLPPTRRETERGGLAGAAGVLAEAGAVFTRRSAGAV